MKNYFDYEKVRQSLKNPKVKSTIVLSAGLIILLVLFWFAGLFRTPRHYRPVKPIADGNMSRYLTNYILPELHNKSQYGQPFDLVLSEQGINDIIARQVDFKSLHQANLSDLSVAFKKGRILLIGKAVYCGFDFIVTIILKPYIDKEGYFFLKASKIQAGQSRVPFIGEAVKRKILRELTDFLNKNITDSTEALLNNRRIEPVFSLNHRKLRIDKITIRDKELMIHFLPWQGG
jgi:hypothetical protein